jgi:hypothetical protein
LSQIGPRWTPSVRHALSHAPQGRSFRETKAGGASRSRQNLLP